MPSKSKAWKECSLQHLADARGKDKGKHEGKDRNRREQSQAGEDWRASVWCRFLNTEPRCFITESDGDGYMIRVTGVSPLSHVSNDVSISWFVADYS